MVVGDDARGKDASLLVDEAHLVGLDDQVADRHDETVVADHDTGALAFLSEGRAAARVRHRSGTDLEDRFEEPFGVGCRGFRGVDLRFSRGGRRRVTGKRREDHGKHRGGDAENGQCTCAGGLHCAKAKSHGDLLKVRST